MLIIIAIILIALFVGVIIYVSKQKGKQPKNQQRYNKY